MSERTTTTKPNRATSFTVEETNEYLKALGEARTARHASEGTFNSPEPDDVTKAVRGIRVDISPSFTAPSDDHEMGAYSNLADLKETYWRQAQRVGTEHGAREGYELEDYLSIGPGRSYADIKERAETKYSEDSIPRNVLEGIDAYYHVLQINPAHAATIIMELIGRHLPAIRQRVKILEESGEAYGQDATGIAFNQFITTEVPYHINTIIEKYGYGDDAIRPVMNKASFYPVPDDEPQENEAALALKESDASGLVEIYDIQSRPFDEEALTAGNEIAHIPEMQVAMIRIQEALIDTSRKYLDAHPERAGGSLENFSEIFVPEDVDGHRELLPNPKLLRAMVNNVMPGIWLSIKRRGGSIEDLNEADIAEGVRLAAKEYKLFQSRIGQFSNYNETTGTVELQSTFQVVCPANSLFPNFLTEHLAEYYEEAKDSPVS